MIYEDKNIELLYRLSVRNILREVVKHDNFALISRRCHIPYCTVYKTKNILLKLKLIEFDKKQVKLTEKGRNVIRIMEQLEKYLLSDLK